MSRMIIGTAKSAKRFALLGKIAIAVSGGESAVELGKVCHEHGFGKVCYATAGVEAGGVAGGILGGYLTERLAEKWITLGACNLVFDVETMGTASVACQVVVTAGFSVTGAYYSAKYGKHEVATLLSNLYPRLEVANG